MIRKLHLQHTIHRGPTCQTGRAGAGLRGEHITGTYAAFIAHTGQQCDRCKSSKLFAFLARKASLEDAQK